jgi:glycosyltransferase involved in cell wall biosynthesis
LTDSPLRFLFLEPFFGGSHRDFAKGLITHSRHEIDLMTLPARFWKWRMRGAALYFYQQIKNLDKYDGLIISDLMSLADFKALTGPSCPPALVYFHENQLTYPLAPGETMDYQFGFTDITTALTADLIRFNSRTHNDAFFAALPGFIDMMPECRPRWVIETIRQKAGVIYPGVEIRNPDENHLEIQSLADSPLIIWNHRWEFDKNPKAFFDALDAVLGQGLEFQLALLGENFQAVPKEFLAAREKYGDRIVQYGYEPECSIYRQWLRRGTVVISTALQENFGLAMVEAISAGCLPLLPRRLAYPEVIPAAYHDQCLYRDQVDLIAKLVRIIIDPDRFSGLSQALATRMEKYDWECQIDAYDDLLVSLADPSGSMVTD